MKIYAISDLHLSINNPKPMNIFGPVWDNYLSQIESDWENKVKDDDVVLIPGDISWAMKLQSALPDLEYICNFNGNKVILKGNHDYWWSSISELRSHLNNNTYAIQNDAVKIGDFIIGGSRGWTPYDNGFESPEDEKIYKRELIRMELSLKAMKNLQQNGEKMIVMTHFPPFNFRLEDNDMTRLFEEYGVDAVVYGHLHKYDKNQKLFYQRNNVKYYLTSCDIVGNKLIEIL